MNASFLTAETPLWLFLALVAVVAGAYLTCGLLVWNERKQVLRDHSVQRRHHPTAPERVEQRWAKEISS